ncbi:MAG: agmatine deiminase family protein [Cytophagales bacterium]
MICTPTPASLGYRMPAEWEPHVSTWFSWPHKEASWPGKFEPVPAVFVEMVKALTPFEFVNINVKDSEMYLQVSKLLIESGVDMQKVTLHVNPTNDAWCRDHGPIYIKKSSGERAIVDWGYNAWGGKYPPFDLDDAVPVLISQKQNLPLFQPGIVMEGGSIEVNGKGTLLTTEACLLNENRNPHLTKEQIEDYLKAYLGVTNILWLGDGIIGDDTDGHVDDMTRFINETTIVTVIEENKEDENYEILLENYERLVQMKDQDGKPFKIVKLPMPDPVYYDDCRLPASYANFLIANSCVLVPTYRCSKDQVAIDILQKEMPNHTIIGIDCTDLIWGLGAIHCVSQQEPA